MAKIVLFIGFLIFSLLGVLNSLYIFLKRKKSSQKTFVCPLNFNCEKVVSGAWSSIFGIKNDILGIIFYSFLFLFSLFWYFLNQFLVGGWFLIIALVGGLLFSLFLLLVQLLIIKNYCFYCLISSFISIILAVLGYFLFIPLLSDNFLGNLKILIWFSIWLPRVFPFFSLILALYLFYHFKKRGNFSLIKKILKKISVGVIIFYFLFATFLTITQYYLWNYFEFTKNFFKIPISFWNGKLNYFFFYSWGRFWFKFLLVLIVSFLWLLFLKILQRKNPRFFEEGDVELGFLAALVSGWPYFLVFLVFSFILVIILSIFRFLFLKEKYTLLREPFIISAILSTLIILLGNNSWLSFFGLKILLI